MNSDELEQLADQLDEPITDEDSFPRRVARLQWLGKKIGRGVATDEEIAEFRREFPRAVDDMNEALHPFVDAYADAVTSVAESLSEPFEALAKSVFIAPRSDDGHSE